MRKFWERNKYQILCFVYLLIYTVSNIAYTKYKERYKVKELCLFGILIGIIGFFIYFKKLYEYKLKAKIKYYYNELIDLIKKLFKRFKRLLGIKSEITLFKGTDSVEYFFGEGFYDKRGKKKKYKMPRWKDLPDNRSRARFIYIKFIMKRMRKGWIFRPYETPDCIAAETVEKPGQNDIFNCYDLARYADDCSPITDEVIEKLLDAEEEA